MFSQKLRGKTALITGASSGIGAALAKELLGRGMNVVLLGRRKELLQQVAGAAPNARIACGDVTKEADLEAAVATAVKEFGGVDLVVANAGFGVAGLVERLTLDDYQRQFDTNVFGVLRTVKASLPELKKSRGGIAIVGSVVGFLSLPSNSAYAMSKFAVRALCDSLRGELAKDGIAVTHIAPGFVKSEIRRVDNQGVFHQSAKDVVPLWIQMPSETAARKIAGALACRKAELILTGHGKLIAFIARHFPRTLRFLVGFLGVTARSEPKSA